MTLGWELLERGERLVVAKYVDLIAGSLTADIPTHADIPEHRQRLLYKEKANPRVEGKIIKAAIALFFCGYPLFTSGSHREQECSSTENRCLAVG
jgi:hypothetical protein